MSRKAGGTIRVLVLEDLPVVREGLTHWLGREQGVEVCAQTSTAAEARSALPKAHANVLLMDLLVQDCDGVSFVREVVASYPEVHIMVFSLYDESIYAERMLRAGAKGYLTKRESADEFLAALRVVAAGGVYVSSRMSLVLLGRLLQPRQMDRGKNGITSLTDRELHVFQLLGAGLSLREIGVRLGVSTKTAQAHRENIKNKLGFDTAAELLRHAALWISEQPRLGVRSIGVR